MLTVAFALTGAGVVFPTDASAASLTTIYSFCSKPDCGDGNGPLAGLIIDAAGNLFGSTSAGGAGSRGTVFELTPGTGTSTWTESVLYSFAGLADGASPRANLFMRKGALYGTTTQGGSNSVGTVFGLTANKAQTRWTEQILHNFCCSDGYLPVAGLVADASGSLYGTTLGGGSGIPGMASGVVFRLTPNADKSVWTETVLYSFCSKANCTDGNAPMAGLIMDPSGALYGTTSAGGSANQGSAFKLTPNADQTVWTETVLHSFCSKAGCADGAHPTAALIMKGKALYGTTSAGGAVNSGTVFALKPNAAGTKWKETILYSFCSVNVQSVCTDGAEPLGSLTMDGSGHLFGTTHAGGLPANAGTVFELAPAAGKAPWTETVLHSFTGFADGYGPDAGLVLDGSGNLYGMTSQTGTVFQVTP